MMIMAVPLTDYLNFCLTSSRVKRFMIPSEMEIFDGCGSPLILDEGKFVYNKGAFPDSLFCLEYGSVCAELSNRKPVQIRNKYTILGAYSLLLNQRYSHSLLTSEPSRLLVYPKKDVKQIFESNSLRVLWLMRRMAGEINRIERQHQAARIKVMTKVNECIQSRQPRMVNRSGKYYIQLQVNDLVELISVDKTVVLEVLKELATRRDIALIGNRIYIPGSGTSYC